MNINLATISVHWRSRNLEMKDRLDIAKMALAIHMAGACQFWRGGSDVINVNLFGHCTDSAPELSLPRTENPCSSNALIVSPVSYFISV